MYDAILRDRPLGGHEGLRKHLAAEDSTERHPLAWTGENIFTRSRAGVGEIEGGQQARQRIAHAL